MIKITKPVIGITTFCKQETNKSYDKVSCSYIQAISKVDGLPLLIPSINNLEDIDNYISLIDGLVLSGGKDISPLYYNEEPKKEIIKTDPTRDKWEIKLFKAAYNLDLPIIGICRGMQLINVALGGTLYQDILVQYNNKLIHLAENNNFNYVHHKVNIDKGSNLSNVLCSNRIKVNSYHHQAIKDLASGLKIAARSEGGIIEAIESINKDFVIGVQWHPEDLIGSYPCFNKLFSSLVFEAEN